MGWGQVEDVQYTGDEGRDLIIHPDQGHTIIVECKHQPENSIGRPIVQKLHSAVVSSNSQKGILDTSGKFTQQAIEHAKILNPPIELYDFARLLDLADRAHIRLVSGSKDAPVLSFICSPESVLREKFFRKTTSEFVSAPSNVNQLISLESTEVQLTPRYHILFDIQQYFETTVGKIHSIKTKNVSMIIDATTGEGLDDTVTNFVRRGSLCETQDLPNLPCKIIRKEFKIDSESMKNSTSSNTTVCPTILEAGKIAKPDRFSGISEN